MGQPAGQGRRGGAGRQEQVPADGLRQRIRPVRTHGGGGGARQHAATDPATNPPGGEKRPPLRFLSPMVVTAA